MLNRRILRQLEERGQQLLRTDWGHSITPGIQHMAMLRCMFVTQVCMLRSQLHTCLCPLHVPRHSHPGLSTH